ncbi:MAG: hypothetical protein HOI95_13220 [Chromatiales bacterium]|nr:hypothetical protein [Chromatiales bacterium]
MRSSPTSDGLIPPTLDFEPFALANLRWGYLAMFSFLLVFSAMFFGLILFLVNVWEWSIVEAGLGVTPGPLLAAILAPRFGQLAGQIGQWPLIIAGGWRSRLVRSTAW